MSRVVSLLGTVAQHEVRRQPVCELARVVEVFDGADANGHTVSVQLKDSALALPHIPVASGASGMAVLPRVGDIVLVLFPRGDMNSAVAIGHIYSSDRRPPQFDKDEAVYLFPGDAGDNTSDVIELRVSVKNGRKVKIALGGDQDTSITLADGKIDLASGDVSVSFREQETRLELKVGDNRMTFADGQGITIDAGTKLTLKASEIAIEGDLKVKVKGAIVELN